MAGDVYPEPEPEPDAVADADDGACDGGWVEVAIEVIEGIIRWWLFRAAAAAFSFVVETERPYPPQGLAVEDVAGGIDTGGAARNCEIREIDGSS